MERLVVNVYCEPNPSDKSINRPDPPYGVGHVGGHSTSPDSASVENRRASPVAVLMVANLPTVVNNATGWLIGILAVLATFFLTLGGVRYMAAGGDPSEVERAKGALRSAGIGYALALLAPVLLTVLKNILGV
jgi:hypothetical protein